MFVSPESLTFIEPMIVPIVIFSSTATLNAVSVGAVSAILFTLTSNATDVLFPAPFVAKTVKLYSVVVSKSNVVLVLMVPVAFMSKLVVLLRVKELMLESPAFVIVIEPITDATVMFSSIDVVKLVMVGGVSIMSLIVMFTLLLKLFPAVFVAVTLRLYSLSVS